MGYAAVFIVGLITGISSVLMFSLAAIQDDDREDRE